jgi:hypothetical protein
MLGSNGCSRQGVRDMFWFDEAGNIVDVGQGVARATIGRGEPVEFLDYGGAGQGEKEGGEGAPLPQPRRLLEPDGFCVRHRHGDVGRLTQDGAQPWEEGGKPPVNFGSKGDSVDALEGVRKVDTKDTEVQIDGGESQRDFVHFLTASGAVAPKLVRGSGFGHSGSERVAQSARRNTVKHRTDHKGTDPSASWFLKRHQGACTESGDDGGGQGAL